MSESKKIDSMPKASIKEFKIFGLHGESDVSIKFKSGAKVIVADNGSGKTTVLNSLYAILDGNFSRLGWLTFSSISISFSSGEIVTFAKDEIPDPLAWVYGQNVSLSEFERAFERPMLVELALALERSGNEIDFKDALSFDARRAISLSPYTFASVFRGLIEARAAYNKKPRYSKALSDKWERIKSNFGLGIIFWPTYRRVEEDLKSLGLSSSNGRWHSSDSRHIYFGMSDVRDAFDRITGEIRFSTGEAFRSVSSAMIDELISGNTLSNSELNRLTSSDAIDLVLARLGKTLSESRRAQLDSYIGGVTDGSSDAKVLIYLLGNLVKIYEGQRDKESRIKRFISVANNYLVNKELRYDEVKVEIDVFKEGADEPLSLEKLSSGEKQLISILSRLYLADGRNYAVIIDEPELSLSLDWQRTLLPDLLRSGKCGFLLAATHSPFIFENELEAYTSTLSIRGIL